MKGEQEDMTIDGSSPLHGTSVTAALGTDIYSS